MAELNLLNHIARFSSMWFSQWCGIYRSAHRLLDFVHLPIIIQTLHFRGMFCFCFPYLWTEERQLMTKTNKIEVFKNWNLKYLNERFLTEDIITNI